MLSRPKGIHKQTQNYLAMFDKVILLLRIGYSKRKIAKILNVPRTFVVRIAKLLELPEQLHVLFRVGKIPLYVVDTLYRWYKQLDKEYSCWELQTELEILTALLVKDAEIWQYVIKRMYPELVKALEICVERHGKAWRETYHDIIEICRELGHDL